MPSRSATVQVRNYLARLPPGTRRTMKHLRDIIRGVAPEAEEHFSYGIPAFAFDGKAFVWYAAFKSHVSVYPIGARIRRAFADELEGYGTSTGTVRFPLNEPLPARLITRLVKARLAEARGARSR
jgi:uncharacterized protein YdhG (YjbR/CyaY superfamily)